jgi:polyisoprenoid-binding protein YceI
MRIPAFATIVALTLGSAASALASGEAAWTVDPGHSSAAFTVKHLVITNVHGTIPIRHAAVTRSEASPIPTAIEATLDPSQIDTHNADRDKDLRGAAWFEADRYPTIVFKSTKIEPGAENAFNVIGDLTIHGITKSVLLAATFEGETVDGKGHHHAGYSATTTIDRRDFGLNWAHRTPGGALVAADTVTVTLDIEAVSN